VPSDAGSGAADIKTLAAGAGSALAGRISGQGLQILIQILVARLLGPSDFGLYALGWTIFRLGRAVGLLGFDKAAVRFGTPLWRSDSSALRAVFDRTLLLSLLTGGLVGVILFLTAPRFASAFGKPGLGPILGWIAVAVPLAVVLRVAAAASCVSQRTGYSVLSEDLIQPLVQIAAVLIFLRLGWGLVGAVAAVPASCALGAAVALGWLVRIFPDAYERRGRSAISSRQLIEFSVEACLVSVFVMLTVWVDRLMVGYFRPAAEVGLYQAASQISLLFTLVLGSFGMIFAPLVAQIHALKERRRLAELYRVSTKWGLYVTTPAFLVILFVPRQVIASTFGSEYASAWLPLVLLTLGQQVNAATGSVGLLLIMSGHQRIWLAVSGGGFVLNIVLNALLIPRWGLVGAAAATAVSIASLFTVGLLLARSLLRIWPYDRRYLKLGLATLATAILLALLRALPAAHPVPTLAWNVLAAVGGFALVLGWFPLDQEERQILLLLRRRLEGYSRRRRA
jgi:O-antigen/teichoic acid export membrane protein